MIAKFKIPIVIKEVKSENSYDFLKELNELSDEQLIAMVRKGIQKLDTDHITLIHTQFKKDNYVTPKDHWGASSLKFGQVARVLFTMENGSLVVMSHLNDYKDYCPADALRILTSNEETYYAHHGHLPSK